MIIYLCIKFQSNTPFLSKDIPRKPKVLRMGRTGRDGRTYGQWWYWMHPHWKWWGHKNTEVGSASLRETMKTEVIWNMLFFTSDNIIFFHYIYSFRIYIDFTAWNKKYIYMTYMCIMIYYQIQLTLVISTSLISNNRLSKSKNLVPA